MFYLRRSNDEETLCQSDHLNVEVIFVAANKYYFQAFYTVSTQYKRYTVTRRITFATFSRTGVELGAFLLRVVDGRNFLK